MGNVLLWHALEPIRHRSVTDYTPCTSKPRRQVDISKQRTVTDKGRGSYPTEEMAFRANDEVKVNICAHCSGSGIIRTDEYDDGLLVGEYVTKADLSALLVEHVDVCGGCESLSVDCGCDWTGGHDGRNETSKGCRQREAGAGAGDVLCMT